MVAIGNKSAHTTPRVNICAFCGPTVESITPEDIFPTWLSKVYQRDLNLHRFYKITVSRMGAREVHDAAQRLDIKAPVVCRRCNSEWMSQIENVTKPVLLPIIRRPHVNVSLTDEQCAALILWTTLKAIVADHADVLAHNAKPFFSPQQRTAFRDHWMLPKRCTIWLARLQQKDTQPAQLDASYVVFPKIPKLKHLHVYTMTLAAFEFIVHAMFLRDIRRPVRGAYSFVPEHLFEFWPKAPRRWSDHLVQIYPDVGAVRWPPPFPLGLHGFKALAHRIGGHPPRKGGMR